MAALIRIATLHQPITVSQSRRHRSQTQLLHTKSSPFGTIKYNTAHFLPWKFHSHGKLTSVRASADFRQGSGGDESRVLKPNWTKALVKFAADNFLPLVFISAVVLGLANPTLGCLADRYYLSKLNTVAIFISGLTLRSEEIGAAAEAWPVGLVGLASILFFTPLFSKLVLLLKLQPQEFVTGLAIFCCMPTTLSSGVVLTRLAGGNSALALAMTVVSNLVGILIIPFSISKFIAAGVGVSIPTAQLLKSLVLMLLLPLVLGKAARELSEGLAKFADENRKLLAVITAIFLSLVPWIQVSRSRAILLMVKPSMFLVANLMGVVLHVVLLAFNALLVKSFSVVSGGSESPFAKKENVSAFLLVASLKTMPFSVAVVEQLGGALGESGLLVLPCIAAHLNQIIVDSFLISNWKQVSNYLFRFQQPPERKAKGLCP